VVNISFFLHYCTQILLSFHPKRVPQPLGVDYTCVLNVQFGCAFHRRMRFQCNFRCQILKNDIENACDGKTRTQTAHPKRKCNRALSREMGDPPYPFVRCGQRLTSPTPPVSTYEFPSQFEEDREEMWDFFFFL
jgi:hypothetical protein